MTCSGQLILRSWRSPKAERGHVLSFEKFNQWLQVITALSVIVGLFFVYQELRQNRVVAQAERLSDVYIENSEIRRFMYDNHTLLLMRKAVDQPNQLTDEEVAELDSFFEIIWTMWAQNVAIGRLGLNASTPEIAANDLTWYLGSPIGRRWVKENQAWLRLEPGLLDALFESFDETPVPTEFTYIEELREGPR